MVQGGDPTGTGGLVTCTIIQVVQGLGHEQTDTRVIGQSIRLLLWNSQVNVHYMENVFCFEVIKNAV